jgi:hypothetical protein
VFSFLTTILGSLHLMSLTLIVAPNVDLAVIDLCYGIPGNAES